MSQEQLEAVLENPSCVYILHLFKVYLDFLRHANGDLSSFWLSYVDMTEIVLGLVRASRKGNWLLYLAMIKEMIPWCFAYDRQNYARYLLVYYLEMTRLQIDHPEMNDHFIRGGFSVQLGGTNPFARIPVDQTIEETANKDTQTAGGTKGFSLQPAAVARYYITAEYRSRCLRNLRLMTDIKTPGLSHADLEPSRIQKDEKDIQSLVDIMENSWRNPFDGPEDLMSLSTGKVATTEVQKDLLNAREQGELAFTKFKQERMQAGEASTKFHDRLPKLKLKTFSDTQRSQKLRTPNKEVVLKADNKLFGHMVLVAGNRKLDMRLVVQHPLGPLPWALANCDGTMKKTNKATLARNLEKRASAADNIPKPSACVIDGMCLIHRMNGEHKTFGGLSECIFAAALQAGTETR